MASIRRSRLTTKVVPPDPESSGTSGNGSLTLELNADIRTLGGSDNVLPTLFWTVS